jgi:hypothetical protein
MIPRYQKVLFALLLVASIAMGAILVRLRERAHDRLLKGEDLAPTTAPVVAPAEQATLMVANDMDESLVPEERSLPLPKDAGARARALLDKLMEIYAAPGATHPVPGVPRAVEQVFLLPAKGRSDAKGQLAVVNLAAAFADGHPAGIEAETLTVESICGTLHANLPQITEVQFLVDGQPRATLAGHADLSRTYLTGAFAAPNPATAAGAKP